MQRHLTKLCAGLILGLSLSLSASAHAQVVYYSQPLVSHTVPVTQSVVQTRLVTAPRHYSYYNYATSYSNNFSNYSYGMAWNSRTSGPAKYVENFYPPETTQHNTGVSSQTYVSSQPLVTSQTCSTGSSVAAQPRFVTQPVVTYREVVPVQSVQVVSQPVTISSEVAPATSVRVYHTPVAALARSATQDVVSQANRLEHNEAKVYYSRSSDGRRIKTYRYEYEIEDRTGRVTIELDAKN